MSTMAKDSPTPLAVEEHDHDDDEIELSLDLSIGRGFRKSPDRNLFLNSSVPPQTHAGGDSHHGDTEGGNSKVQRKRKRNETQTNGFDDARSSERETIIGCKSFNNGEINASDSQHNESGIVTPVVWRLNQGNQEPVVTGGGKNDDNGSGAGSSSVVSSSGFKSSASQQDCSKSSEEGGIDPIGIHGAITSSEVINNPNINGPPPCSRRHHKKDKETDNHKPSPPTTNTQLEEPHNNNNSQTLRPPRIPCVSTTGNGPHGRTISGFLYKYTNTEISIVCACHGNSFSPAQFVEHAGGVDISHPLRLITLIPSPFRPFAS